MADHSPIKKNKKLRISTGFAALLLCAGAAFAGDLNIESGGTLKGSGTVSGGTLNLLSGGSLAPGDSPGCIASGDLSLNSGGALDIEIEGTSVCTEHDQLSVTGSVSLGSATLNIDASSYSLNLGDTFTIIDNDGSDAVSGTFNGLSEGGEVDQGSYVFAVSYVGGDGNDVTLIALYSQSITFNTIADQEYGNTLSLSATASSGLPTTLSSSTTSVCNVSGGTLTFSDLGTCTITASQSGDASYNAAESVTHTFSVLKASQSISFASIADKDYGDADFSVSVSSDSGLSVSLVSNTPSVCSLSGSSVSLIDTGTCSLTASLDGNYFYYAAADVTRTFAVNSVDSDGDEIEDADDAFPDDPTESVDTDGDGTGDNADKDDDNDGVLDTDDAFPYDVSEDTDSDGDGVGDNSDAFPNDASETVDSDGDGVGDNADTDDDNDGVEDSDDAFPYDDSEDTDSDGDGVGDNSDAFPNDASETADTDADGIGDNGDVDCDGDGLIEIGSVDDLYYINNNLSGTAYNDGSGDDSTGCGDGVSVTACSGYELINDIDFDTDGDGDIADEAYFNDNAGWQPIGESFSGTLDGNGYSILNLYINRVDEDNVGLFSKVQSATFRDLSISGSVSGNNYVGLLFGRNPQSNSYQVKVSDILASGTVSGNNYVGAIAGYAYLTRTGNTGLWSDAEVISSGSYAGGLLGSVSSSYSPFIISNAEFVGTVTGVDDVGGVIGWSPFVELNDSYADASVTGSGSNVGGLVGRGRYLTIENSFALGSVSGIENVGGLVGLIDSLDSEEIVDSFAANSVSGDQYVGGLVGYVDTSSYSMTLQRVYAAGSLSGSSDSGGLIGYSASTLSVDEAYWDTEVSGQSSTYGDAGSGLTTAELQCPTEPADGSCLTFVYSSWDTAEWDFGTDSQYPALIIDSVTYRDTDGDGVWDTLDAFPDDASESADSDGDGVGDNADEFPDDAGDSLDSDGDGVGDNADAFPYDASEDTDSDGDGVGDNADAYPDDASETADSDGDGVGDNADDFPNDATETTDSDGDGVGDNADAFPNDATETVDSDGDGVGDNADAFPNDASETADSDGDGVGDNADAFPNDATETVDSDGDGVGDNADAFPNDAGETADTDGDGVGDNADAFPGDPSETVDSDGDGVGNNSDAFPLDSSETADSDGDGVGDNTDAFPNDATETVDSDGDGVGDNADAFPNDATETVDSDGDGVGDNTDAFPNDATETVDSDGDGVGDNADAFPNDAMETADSDGDGVGDNADAFPDDASETVDTDGDGIGDNADPDIDNDGVDNGADAFPYDGTETVDSDSDGTGDNADVDVDGDGLIEIATLDQLDNIRNNLGGSAYNDGSGDDSSGCGDNDTVFSCSGYELTADLDFDTNGDGAVDASDDYYNAGEGWQPIGSSTGPFTAVFQGNGYRIRNLVIDRPDTDGVGLFGELDGAEVHDLGLGGNLMDIAGNQYVGALAGRAYSAIISDSYATGPVGATGAFAGGLVGYAEAGSISASFAGGDVTGGDAAGGLAGYIDNVSVSASYAAGDVNGGIAVGGLAGYVYGGASIEASYAVGAVAGDSLLGGLVGNLDSSTVTYSYWATDSSGIDSLYGEATSATELGNAGATLAELRCPSDADDTGCSAYTLYGNWNAYVDDDGDAYWDFGTDAQLPALNFQGTVYRDFDSDGSFDFEDSDDDNDGADDGSDAFPYDASENADSDGDGVGDNSDAFPNDSSETVDSDGDGVGDNSDAFPNDSSETADSDGDGVGDNSDAFPSDSSETADSDGDGVGDNTDAFPSDSSETADSDGDGVGDNADDFPSDATETADSDGDGVGDNADAFPNDASETVDSDGDGVGDNSDAFPNDASETADADGDGVGDNADAFPNDATETVDSDGDGVGDNADAFPNDASETTDTDGDGVGDNTDAFPGDPSETVDSDGDGVGNNSDAFPLDARESADSDGDGVGDNADAFPNDATETTDSDGDGVGDNTDAFPLDASETVDSDGDGVGDNADAFPNDGTETIDSDGDGVGDNSDATPNGDSADTDNDGMPDGFEATYGLDINDTSDADGDLDGDGLTNLEEYEAGLDPTTDDVAPVLTVPADIEVDSTGSTTSVELGTATAVDGKDGDLVPAADDTGPFVPGRHTITWTATDAAGNSAAETQTVDVIPLVSVAEAQTVQEGSSGSVEFSLNGSPISYPVTVPYSISGTVDSNDHDLVDGSVEIESGLSASIDFATVVDGVYEGVETIVVTLGEPDNAALGSGVEQVINITEENVAPGISISLIQGDEPVASVYADAGEVTLHALTSDPNPDDSHSYSWSSSVLAPLNGYDEETFVFDPSGLSGAFEVSASVTDSGGERASASLLLRVDGETPTLSEGADTDGDGTSDADEGVTDSDGDRIPDYLDADSVASNLLPADGLGSFIQGETGSSLALGDSAYAAGYGISLIGLDDIDNLYGEDLAGTGSYLFLHGIFDFEVRGVESGSSTQVVLPLTAALLADARYVKYQRAIGWVEFTEDTANSVASAAGELGVCPEPGSDDYQPGLAEGHFCVQLTIEDGGPNDADGEANGTVVDPSAVGTLSVPAPEVGASAGALEETGFEGGDGEKVVFSFTLESDSTDAELSELTLQASGDLDEIADVGEVNLYLDENGNGVAEASELVGSGSYTADNGSLVFTLNQVYQLPIGESRFLVTYQF